MNLNVSGHHVEVTPAIRSYVRTKLERVTRHFDHVIDAHVILTVDKIRQKAEVTLHVRGKDLHCESEEGDLYAAIDLLADKLDRQVLKHKEKLALHRHEGAGIKRDVAKDEARPAAAPAVPDAVPGV